MTTQPFPRFADLNSIADELSGDSAKANIVAIIRRASVAQACVGDLAQAGSSLDALDALLVSPRKRGTLERSATEMALLFTAVSLYARATATTAKKGERGSIQIGEKLSEDQRADHEALIRIRNRAIAHVHDDEPIEGELWHRNEMFLVELAPAWQPAGAVKRFQFHRPTFDRLKRQVPLAQTIITDVYHRHLNKLVDLMNADPPALAVFERHLFDPRERFDGAEGVKAVLAGRARGRTSFLA